MADAFVVADDKADEVVLSLVDATFEVSLGALAVTDASPTPLFSAPPPDVDDDAAALIAA